VGRRVVGCSPVWRCITHSWKKKMKRGEKKKNSCEKWCPKFKATSIRIHFSAWWIIEQQPEQPWVLALFCDGFCMNKTLFGPQSCLRCRDTALCSNMEIALGIFLFGYSFWFSVLCPCISNYACLSLSVLNFYLPPCLAFTFCHFPLIASLLYSLFFSQQLSVKEGEWAASRWSCTTSK